MVIGYPGLITVRRKKRVYTSTVISMVNGVHGLYLVKNNMLLIMLWGKQKELGSSGLRTVQRSWMGPIKKGKNGMDILTENILLMERKLLNM